MNRIVDIISRADKSTSTIRLYISVNFISFVGTWTERIAMGWLTWVLTQSAFWTGFVTMSVILPAAILGPFLAVFAENWNVRAALVATSSVLAGFSFLTFALASSGGIHLGWLVGISIAVGLVSAAMHPVRLLVISLIASRESMAKAVGWSAIAFNASRVVGPATAGFLIATAGVNWAFLANAVSYLPFVVVVSLIGMRPRQKTGDQAANVWSGLVAGIRYALQEPVIRWYLLLATASGFVVRGVVENLPAVVGGMFNGSATELTYVTTAAGIGSVLAAIAIGWLRQDLHKLQNMLILQLFLSSTLCLVFATSLPFAANVVLVAALGFAATTIGVGSQVIVQLSVDDLYRARILTWWSTLGFGGVSISGLGLGLVGDLYAMNWAIAVLGVVGLVAAAGFLVTRRMARQQQV